MCAAHRDSLLCWKTHIDHLCKRWRCDSPAQCMRMFTMASVEQQSDTVLIACITVILM